MIGVPGGGGSVFGSPAIGKIFGPEKSVLCSDSIWNPYLSTRNALEDTELDALSPELHIKECETMDEPFRMREGRG